MLHDKRKNFKYEYGMTSTLLTITPLRRSRRARRWPLHLWGGHNEHATDFYTSDMVMTSTSVTFTPPISGVLMTSRPVTFIPLRWSWRALGDLYTSAEVITSTLLIVTPLRRSWRARRWPLHLWGGHGCVRWFIYGFAEYFRFCLSINKNSRIICFQWMNQTTKRKAPFGRAVLTRTTRKDKHRKYRPISETRNALKLNQ